MLKRCTSCFACNFICPNGCNPAQRIMDIWHERSVQHGLPERARYYLPDADLNFRTYVVDRLPPEEKALVKSWEDTSPCREIFYPGCNIITVPHITQTRLLDGFTIRGSLKLCCGETYYRTGQYEMAEKAARRINAWQEQVGFEKMVIPCTAGRNMFTNVLPKLGLKRNFEVEHLLPRLLERFENGEIEIKQRFEKTVTLQESCYGKCFGDDFMDVPRALLRLVGATVVEEEVARFLQDEGLVFTSDAPAAAETLAEIAGRTCYMSFGKGRKSNQEYIENILSSKHGSVLEHAVWCLLITGVSRALTHELVRHRAGFGYSQLSQRYVDESNARYVIPPLYQENDELRQKWQQMIEQARAAYTDLAEATIQYVQEKHPEMSPRDRRKWARQAARSVLPNACETKIFVTGNARSWRHFVELRGNVHADTEIRLLAVEVCRVLKKESPNIFSDIEIAEEADGIPSVRVIHSKV